MLRSLPTSTFDCQEMSSTGTHPLAAAAAAASDANVAAAAAAGAVADDDAIVCSAVCLSLSSIFVFFIRRFDKIELKLSRRR